MIQNARGRALGPIGNRFLQIEAELGSKAKFFGEAGLETGPAQASGG